MRSSLGRWISSIVSISLLFSLAACNQFQIVKPVSKSPKITTSNGSTGGGSSGGLSYSGGYFSLTKNTVITPIAPTLTPGAGSVYSISPALPSGLALSSSTGTISGTPTSPKALTNYTITAVGGGKTLTAQFNLEVVTTHPTNSSVTAAITSATANGTSKLNIVVRLMTANNTPVPNNQIVLYSSRNATDIIEAINSKTDATGKAYFTVKSSTAGTSNLFAADINDQISIVPIATVQFVPGTATQLIYTQAPTSTVAGATFTVEVTARDANGNTATGFTGNASIVSSDPNATLPASPVPFTNGVAQISGNVLKTMGSQSVNVASGALSAGARSITVNPGSASRLSFQVQPSTTATAGADLSIQPSVVVTDAHGNLISNSSAPVTLEAFSDTACFQVINGALTAAVNPVSAVSGVASFNGVKVLKTHALRIGARSTGGLISACSNAVAVSPAAPFAANSGITGTGPVIANGVQSSAITISIQDSFNNPIPGVVPTFSATDTGGSNQYGTCSATDSTGTAACSLKSNKAETKNLSILTPVAHAGGVVTFSSSMLASFTVSGFPGSVVAGTPNSLIITALDSAQNIVTGYTGTVNITSDAPQSALGSSITFDPADQGQKTLSGLILKSAGTWKIEVSDSSAPSLKGSQDGIVVTPSSYSDSQSMLTVATANVTSGSSVLVTLTARDAYGNTNPTGVPEAGSISFTSTTNPGTGSFGSVTATGSGVFTSNFTGILSGLVTLGAQISGVTQSATTPVTVNPAAASALFLSSVPASINAGTAFNLGVTAKDPAGNVATGFSGTVTITSSDAGATLPTPALLSNGTGTFSTVLNTATTSTVTAASGALSVTSSNITVNALAASQLELTSVPTSRTAGDAFTFTVRAKDSLGNIAPTYGGTVAITSSDPQATLPTPAQLTNGVGTFTVTLKTAGARTLTASDGTRSIQSGTITVNHAAATQIVLSNDTIDTAGDGINVTVTAKDAYNNTATGYAGTISWTSNDPNPNTVLPAPSTLTAGTKVSRVKCVTVGNRTFTVSDGTLSTTGSVTIVPAPTASLTLSSLSNVSAGTAQNITVSLKDAYDNITPSTTCTLSFTSNDPQAVFPGSSSFTGANGTFSVTFKTSGASQSLTATCVAGANTFTDSKTAAVQPGAYSAAQSVATASTASLASGGTLTATLTTKDAFGNTNPSGLPALEQVVFTSTASPGSGTFGSATSSGNGVYTATFTGVNAGSVTLGATLASVAVGNTASISVQSGAATTLAVTSVPTTTTAGSAFNVVVTARDAQNNVVTGFSDSIQFTSTDGNALLPSPGTLTNGTGTFSITLRTAGSQTLTFTPQGTSGLPATISNSITVNPAAATQLLVTGLNATSTAGNISGFTVTARDSFGNTDTNFSGTLTTTSSDSIAVLPPPAGLTNGVGSFNITLRTAGTQTFSLSDGGSLATTLQTVTVSASIMAAATSILTASAPSVVSGSSITGTLTTKDAFGNPNPSNANVSLISMTATNSVGSGSWGAITHQGSGVFTAPFTGSLAGTVTLGATIATSPISNNTSVTVLPGVATQLIVSGLPASTVAGNSLSFAVTARDSANNVATGFAGTVTFGSSDGQANVPSSQTLTSGTATLTATLKTSGTQTLTATAGALSGSSNTLVNPAAYDLTQSAVTASSAAVTSGSSITVTLTAKDAYGNPNPSGLPASTSSFAFTSTSVSGAGNYGSVNGLGSGVYQASFSGVAAGSVTLGATILGSAVGVNAPITVNPAPPASFEFVSMPSSVTAGSAFTFTVNARDLNNNLSTGFNSPVTLTSTDTQAVLSGPVTFAGGSGSFTATLKTAPQKILTVTNGSVSSSHTMNVDPGAASQLVLGSVPSSTVAGTAFTISITARDPFGNTATGYTASVGLTSNDPLASLPIAATLTNGTGMRTVTLRTSGNRSITASDGTLTRNSSVIAVTPGAYSVAQSSVTLSSNVLRSGLSLTASLNATDAFGNSNPTGLPAASGVAFSLSGGGSGAFGPVSGPVGGIYQALFTGENNTNNGASSIGASISGVAVGNPAALTIFSPLAIIPGSFSFPIGRPLALNFSASGGSPGYTYSIVSGPGAGSGITSGGSLNLSNIPRSAGQQTVVRVTDSQNDSVDCIITHVSMIGSGDTLASATFGNETFIGGTFRTLSPHQARGFMPLDPATGAISDLGMASGFDGSIRAIVTSGRFVYVGGNFTSYQGRPAQNIAKIDTLTGEMEEGFAGQASTNGAVNALALVGQNLYLGGEFTSCSSGHSDHLCAIDALSGDFLQDPLNIPNHMPPGSTVNALVSDGVSLFAGGYFESYQGSSDIQGIVKISMVTGSADPSFHTMKNLESSTGGSTVNAISLVSGDLYVGGDFTQYRGDSRGVQIVKLNASTGAIDFNFNSFTPAAPGGAVYAIAEDGGQLYLGGDFESYRDDHRGYRLARLDRFSGDLNTLEFNTQVDLGPGGVVRTLSVLNDTLLIGGDFTDYRGDSRGDRLALLSKHTGAMDTSFNGVIDGGPDLMVRTIQYSNGRFYVGGDFRSYRGIPAQYLAKIDNSTGLIDMNFTQPMGPDERVRAIAYHPSVGLFVGGDFTNYRGSDNGLYLLKLNPSSGDLDPSFNSSGSGPNARVQAIAIDTSSSAVYIGGIFTTYRNDPAGFRLAKLNSNNGALDTTFNRFASQGPSSDVKALSVGPAGVYVGGNFTSYRNDTRGVRLIKVNTIDGALDTAFNSVAGAGPNGPVLAIAAEWNPADPMTGDVYAGGEFSSYRGIAVNNLISVRRGSGNLNIPFSQGGGTTGPVYTLSIDNWTGWLYVGGGFSHYSGMSYPYFLMLGTNGELVPDLSGGFDGPVYTVSWDGSMDGNVFIGGSFKSHLDRFGISGACMMRPSSGIVLW